MSLILSYKDHLTSLIFFALPCLVLAIILKGWNCVVPFTVKALGSEVDLSHLLVAHFLDRGVFPGEDEGGAKEDLGRPVPGEGHKAHAFLEVAVAGQEFG